MNQTKSVHENIFSNKYFLLNTVISLIIKISKIILLTHKIRKCKGKIRAHQLLDQLADILT